MKEMNERKKKETEKKDDRRKKLKERLKIKTVCV